MGCRVSKSSIRDIELANSGFEKIEWVKKRMPILNSIRQKFEKTQPFAGKTIAMSIHLEAKTAYMALVLQSGGAKISITGCNLLTTQDDCAAALVKSGITVHAWRNATKEEYITHLHSVLNSRPDLILDDGADMTALIHDKRKELIPKILGGSEETTCGIVRLKAMDKAGVLSFPMIAVNDACMKHMFDNRFGTGQSTLESIMHATNLTICGKVVVIVGYGWCGKGIAMRARGMGGRVIVCEVDPIPANEALMDGFEVMPLIDAAPIGDYFITATGCNKVITQEHFCRMKDGAIMANSGHFDVEVYKPDLIKLAGEPIRVRDYIDEYSMSDGRKLYLLGEGRLVNLVASNGHPVEIIDLSFSLQCLAQEYVVKNYQYLKKGLIQMPLELDREVAQVRLSTLGISLDSLSKEQMEYLNSWNVTL